MELPRARLAISTHVTSTHILLMKTSIAREEIIFYLRGNRGKYLSN